MKGNVTVVITAKHSDTRLSPHIRRVNATAAIPAGAIASKNTQVAISSDSRDIP
jgi:hypothetical protein